VRGIVDYEATPPCLRCSGDEDRATQGRRRRAITCAQRSDRDVVVDLSDLRFADTSLVLDLAMLARRLRQRDRMLRLRDAQPQVRTLIERVGLDRIPGVAVDLPPFPA